MVLRQRWIWSSVAFLVVLIPLVSLVIRTPKVYRSSATVLIERQQIPEELVRPTVTAPLEVRLQIMQQEILSRGHLESLIQQVGLYDDLRKTGTAERVIVQMRKA